jgi:hypothetical protein
MFEKLREEIAALLHPAGPAPQPPPDGPIVHQILDPGFLHEQLETIQAAGGEHLSEDQYEEMFADLKRDDASPVSGADPTQGKQAYLPRSPAVSLLQSTLTDCITSRFDDLLERQPPEDRSFADYALEGTDVFRKFGPCDAHWVESVISKGLSLLDHKPDFVNKPPTVPIADNARLVVVGDWGTGIAGAQAVGEQMAAKIAEGKAQGREVHALHLGDVYYSGWKEEYEARFMPYWPVGSAGEGVGSWALNGNHDMYSGGHGYFGYLLRDPRFAEHRGSSYFCLQNANWQLLGLDSSFDNEKLAGGQAEWVAEKHADTKRKTMLLSHHEPFSSYVKVEPEMLNELQPAFDRRPIDAWLWGHEHLCCTYETGREDYLKFGSCIGHGGVPVLHEEKPKPDDVTWHDDGYQTMPSGDKWQLFGFAVLDFNGASIDVRYYNQNGGEPVNGDQIE